MINLEELLVSSDSEQCELWVFGYGSILWKTGFEYHSKECGFIQGYDRRFWQGNTHHRGTPAEPGRVATLVPNPHGRVWGVAFQLVGQEMIRAGLDHLGMRECTKGGYGIVNTSFFKRDNSENSTPTIAFYATPENELFLGDDSYENIATQVVHSHGFAGSNTEYVLRLADYVRQFIPEDKDSHLFGIVKEMLKLLSVNHKLLTPHVLIVVKDCRYFRTVMFKALQHFAKKVFRKLKNSLFEIF